MNIVVVGHVDHGKSTLIGRLLADTNSLPVGKLEQVKRTCQLNAKPFEYAFLLDALKDEQSQGITIDTARVFFKTMKREYIIIDAPGHVEFLKNMVSGAARAEAAILLIDAQEGIAENSKRHAYLLSMLGIQQVVVAINKMDLVRYDEKIFHKIKAEYSDFLSRIGINPTEYVPISAGNGVNLISLSDKTKWYKGSTILQLMDSFRKEREDAENNFRMYVQGVYKFTEAGDNRRIIAGTIHSGTLNVGDEIILLPSGKTTRVKSIEVFGTNGLTTAVAGMAIGITTSTEIYVKNGELICKTNESLPFTGNCFRANIFWMGKHDFITNKQYKLKIGTHKTEMVSEKIETVLDASTLSVMNEPSRVKKHEVAQVILRTVRPLAFDVAGQAKDTSRFVIVDGYDIAGGGIITQPLEEKSEGVNDMKEFERELYSLIKKYFPHWEIVIHQ